MVGILLRDAEICRFLKKNNVIICLSLDGYGENHDRNRVKINDTPTYNEILSIVREHFGDYPLIYSLCCIDYKTDPVRLYEFYMKNDRIQGGEVPHLLRVSRINDTDTDYYSQFTQEDIERYVSGISKLEELYLKKIRDNEEDWFLDMIDKINHINPEYFENKIKKNIANSISAENTIVNLINIMLS